MDIKPSTPELKTNTENISQQNSTQPNLIHKQNRLLKIVLVVMTMVVVLAVSGMAYFYSQYMSVKLNSVVQVSPTPTAQTETDAFVVPSDWKTYENKEYGFNVKYNPASAPIVEEQNEDLGQFSYALLVKFGTNPLKFPNGYELRVARAFSIDQLETEIIGHLADKIDSKMTIMINGITWEKINYTNFLTTNNISITQALSSTDEYSIIITATTEDIDQILSTFRFTDASVSTNTPKTNSVTYVAPSTWKRAIHVSGLNFCLPPKWEYGSGNDGGIYFNRDTNFKPIITYLQDLPYTDGSRRDAYYKYWESEYPNVRDLVTVSEVNINGNTALLIKPSSTVSEAKSAPDGSLAVVWFAGNKLWKAGLSGWQDINTSQSAFLSDFYKMISCSF